MHGVWSVAIRGALRGMERIGLDATAIRDECGFSPERLDDPEARFALEEGARMWECAVRHWGGPDVAVRAGGQIRTEDYDALILHAATATTLRGRLEALARHSILITNGATRVEIHEGPEHLFVRYVPPSPLVRDFGIAAMVGRIRAWAVRPSHVELAGDPLATESTYRELFACPVLFRRAYDRVALPLEDVDCELPTPLAGVRELAMREVARLVASLPSSNDALDEARRVLATMLGHDQPSLDEVAKRLGTSRRTLQRRLGERGTSFRELVDEVRCHLAREHLGRPGLAIAEVGYLLGFQDVSAFHKAFKRWTGETPAAFRARLR